MTTIRDIISSNGSAHRDLVAVACEQLRDCLGERGLRIKLGEHNGLLETVRGVGYRLGAQ